MCVVQNGCRNDDSINLLSLNSSPVLLVYKADKPTSTEDMLGKIEKKLGLHHRLKIVFFDFAVNLCSELVIRGEMYDVICNMSWHIFNMTSLC